MICLVLAGNLKVKVVFFLQNSAQIPTLEAFIIVYVC